MPAGTRRSWLEKATRGNTAISWLCPRSSSAAAWQSACPGHGEEWRVKTVPAVQMRTKLKNKHLHGVTIQHALSSSPTQVLNSTLEDAPGKVLPGVHPLSTNRYASYFPGVRNGWQREHIGQQRRVTVPSRSEDASSRAA